MGITKSCGEGGGKCSEYGLGGNVIIVLTHLIMVGGFAGQFFFHNCPGFPSFNTSGSHDSLIQTFRNLIIERGENCMENLNSMY